MINEKDYRPRVSQLELGILVSSVKVYLEANKTKLPAHYLEVVAKLIRKMEDEYEVRWVKHYE